MMAPESWVWIAAVAVGMALVLQALLSALETALISARRSRLCQCAGGNEARLKRAEAILDQPSAFETAGHVTETICEAITYSGAALIGIGIAAQTTPHQATSVHLWRALLRQAVPTVILSLLLAVLAVLLLGEALPKTLATRAPERILLRWAGFMQAYSTALAPAVYLVRWIGRVAGRLLDIRPDPAARAARTEEEIKMIVGGSAEEGEIEEEEKEMIHSIFDFTESVARQIMVPRIQIHGIEADATLEEAVSVILESGHTRLPVYEGTLDQIEGILHAKDLMRQLFQEERQASVRHLVRPAYFVPETKKLDELLADFRRQRAQLAIVVDEFGCTAGLVTLEDVLEEIVGEIQDEYDEEEPAIRAIEPGTSVVDAHLTIDDVNEELDLDLPPGDYETLGGLVYDLFGRPPEVGERVTFNGVSFTVEETDGPRLVKIRVSRVEVDAVVAGEAGQSAVSE